MPGTSEGCLARDRGHHHRHPPPSFANCRLPMAYSPHELAASRQERKADGPTGPPGRPARVGCIVGADTATAWHPGSRGASRAAGQRAERDRPFEFRGCGLPRAPPRGTWAGEPSEQWVDLSLVAVGQDVSAAQTLRDLLRCVAPELRRQRVSGLVCLAADDWLVRGLIEAGFREIEQVVSYLRPHHGAAPGLPSAGRSAPCRRGRRRHDPPAERRSVPTVLAV